MRITLLAIFSLTFILIISSCNTETGCTSKDNLIKMSNDFFDNYEKNKKALKKEEIKAKNIEFDALIENCYKKFKEEMSPEERQAFWKKGVVFFFNRINGSHGLNTTASLNPELDNYIQLEVNQVVNESGPDFMQVLTKALQSQTPSNMVPSY